MSARGSTWKRWLGTADGATAAGLGGEAISSRPPWKSWTKTRPVRADGRGHAAVAGDDLGLVAGQGVGGQPPGLVDSGRLEDDHPRPACRARLVVGDELVRRQVIVDERGLVRGRDDPVRQLDGTEPQWAQEMAQSTAELALEGGPLRVAERTGAACLGVARHEDGLRLGGELAADRDDLLPCRHARRADPREPEPRHDRVVVLRQLAPEVDRHARRHIAPGVAGVSERPLEPLVPHLFEVGEVDRVVHVAVGVLVAPADLDLLLVHVASRVERMV